MSEKLSDISRPLATRRLDINGKTYLESGTTEIPKAPGKPFAWWFLLLVIIIAVPAAFLIHMPETPLERAISLIKANRPAAALTILEEIAHKQPDNSLYLPWLAQCYLNTDRLAEGRTALDTAIKLKLPSSTLSPIVLNFSKYYRQRADYAEAEKLLLTAQSVCPASNFQDERKAIYGEWADDDARKNQVEQAISHLEVLASLESGKLTDKMSHSLVDLYRQQAALEETQNGNDNKATQLLEKSLLIADEPASRMALGNLYAKNNDFKNAAVHFAKVCKDDPNNLEARHKLIDYSIKSDDFQGAQIAASELAEREKSVPNFALLATIDLKLKNFAGAVRALEEASTLAPKDLELLKQLEHALSNWSDDLANHGKQEESAAVKTKRDRVSETMKAIEKEQNVADDKEKEVEPLTTLAPGDLPVSLTTSRIWLSKGSVTPEGEIKLKNIGIDQVSDLALTVAFFDSTLKKRTGSVTLSAAGINHPLPPGQSRVVYFSSPNTMRGDHQLSVLIYWKGRLIRELPVVKEH